MPFESNLTQYFFPVFLGLILPIAKLVSYVDSSFWCVSKNIFW